jgi:hypothetical protein
MIGRTIRTARITVLRKDSSGSSDWRVCRCSCGREFIANGSDVKHGYTRNCGSDERKVELKEHKGAVFEIKVRILPF